MKLASLSLRERERGFVVGGSGTGKSTLAEALIVDFDRRYRARGSRVLILDSKPRFRAEFQANGRPAARLYRAWDHGPVVPGSALVTAPEQLAVAWTVGHRIAIAQAASSRDVPMLVGCAAAFLASARTGRPQLLYVDESMDFFRGNGSPIGGEDALLRSARAGREKGEACLFSSQRTRGIPAQLMEELTKLYLFRLDFITDAKRLLEMGAPAAVIHDMPTEEGEFVYWTKANYSRVWGPYKLELPTRPATRPAAHR